MKPNDLLRDYVQRVEDGMSTPKSSFILHCLSYFEPNFSDDFFIAMYDLAEMIFSINI